MLRLFFGLILGLALAFSSTAQTVFDLRGNPAELSGSTVTPVVGPTGTYVKVGTGAAIFSPVPAIPPATTEGTGVYFTACCGSTNVAYYKFTGAGLLGIFNPITGHIEFNLTSRQAFASRTGSRYVFDVQDVAGASRMRFVVQIIGTSPKRLVFDWTGRNVANGYWYVPAGTEDQWFGAGVTLPVSMDWFGTTFTVKLGGKTFTNVYTPPTYAWSASSIFTIGARVAGGVASYASDDIISGFTILGTIAPPPPPPPPVTVPPAFTSGNAVMFIGGTVSNFTAVATGEPAPSLSLDGTLPPGVTFTPATGVFAGTPSALGTFPVTLTATNSAGAITQTLTITVAPPPTVAFTCPMVYDSVNKTVSIAACQLPPLVPSSVLSVLSLEIGLNGGIAVNGQVNDTKFSATLATLKQQ